MASSSSSNDNGSSKDTLRSYPAGHHASVLKSHLARTAQNSAEHLLPHLKPGMKILDIGCGPGTITASLGNLVGPSGSIIGLDASEDVIQQAQSINAGKTQHKNVTFESGDAFNTRFEDGTFDVVHAHQVLQHVRDPASLIREMHRVVRKNGGILSLREADLTSASIYPDTSPHATYADFSRVYRATTLSSGADTQTCRKLHVHLRDAGLKDEDVQVTARALMYGGNNRQEAQWWGGLWAERCLEPESGFYKGAIQGGHASHEEMERLASMWMDWASCDDAWFAVINGEAIVNVK